MERGSGKPRVFGGFWGWGGVDVGVGIWNGMSEVGEEPGRRRGTRTLRKRATSEGRSLRGRKLKGERRVSTEDFQEIIIDKRQ